MSVQAGSKGSSAGIGGLAVDPASRELYVSDLDTGLIHRFSISQKNDIGQFDHGVAGRPMRGLPAVADDGSRLNIESPDFDPGKPATWGITQTERRIDALAVHDGRLFYAVAQGPEIWSVGLGPDGNFTNDIRFETAIQSEKPFPITGIAFDASGGMIVAQRGALQNPEDYSSFVEAGPAEVLRLKPEAPDDSKTPGRWLQGEAQEYAAGQAEDHRASSGGLALQYAYKSDGTLDVASCNGTVLFSTDAIGEKLAGHGLQMSAVDAVRPANVPPTKQCLPRLEPTARRCRCARLCGRCCCLGSVRRGGLSTDRRIGRRCRRAAHRRRRSRIAWRWRCRNGFPGSCAAYTR